jgi:hypothetical protein
MATSPDNPGKISTFSRVLAWILLALNLLVLATCLYFALESGRTSNLGITVPMLILIALSTLLFGFAAITGRSPRWLSSIDTMHEREALHDIPRTPKAGRGIAFATTILVFGLVLVFFGRKLGIFEGETGWFGAAVFFVAWLVVVLLLWRNLRKGSR